MQKTTLTLAALALLSTTFAASAFSGELPKVNIGRTPTYVFDNVVYLSTTCPREDYRIFARLRVDTVIDLGTSGTEREVVEAAGMRYFHVPLDRELPSSSDALATVLASLDGADRDRRILVHDHDGDEMGALWAVYRASAGADIDTALHEARLLGLYDRALVGQVRELTSDR